VFESSSALMIDRFVFVGADAVPLGTMPPLGLPPPDAEAHASPVAATAMSAI